MRSILLIAVVLMLVVADSALAAGGTRIRFGRFATTVRAGCGADVCASPCGVKVAYGGGGGYGYGGGGCYSGHCGQGGGGCGVYAQPLVAAIPCQQGGGCAQGTCAYASGGAPFGVNCQPNYGTHSQTCTESFLPYGQPATFAGPQFAPSEGAIRIRGY